MEIIRGKQQTPWKVCVYGVPGIGKTTLSQYAPKPIVVDLEKGADRVDVDKTPHIQTWEELGAALNYINKETDYETIVIDSLTSLEKLLIAKTIAEDQKKRPNLADWGYGAGHEVLAANFSLFLQKLFMLGGKRNLLLIGHQRIERYEDPTNEGYDRYTIDVHKKVIPILVSNMDAVFFAHYEAFSRTADTGDGRAKGFGTGKRIVQTQEMPAYVAKNRFDLVGAHPFDKDLFTKLQPKQLTQEPSNAKPV